MGGLPKGKLVGGVRGTCGKTGGLRNRSLWDKHSIFNQTAGKALLQTEVKRSAKSLLSCENAVRKKAKNQKRIKISILQCKNSKSG